MSDMAKAAKPLRSNPHNPPPQDWLWHQKGTRKGVGPVVPMRRRHEDVSVQMDS